MKVVINSCYGGFGLSDEAMEAVLKRKGIKYWKSDKRHFGSYDYFRCPPEEYERLLKEEREKPPGPSRFTESNDLFLSYRDWDRWDPDVVAVVEELGDAASGAFANLRVVEIPFTDDLGWHITDYDGIETIEEDHRSWG